ncbi:MAG: DUF1440 domain-containing protein [Halomonas sp.]|nr:DUF1440 domain-containing protein [Halomonas sp.]
MRRETHTSDSRNVMMDALLGAVAGTVGVWALDRIDWFMFNHEDPAARRQTQAVRPHHAAPAQVAADKAAEAMGKEVSNPEKSVPGTMIHYSLGTIPGAIYGAMHTPLIGTGRGSLFGLSLFLMQDEGLNAISGLSARPSDYPWQAHARGFIAHLVYGVATDTVFRALKTTARAASKQSK